MMNHFTKEEKLKICFLQMGNKFQLPMDMIILLYKYKIKSEEEDLNKIRIEYKNLINMLCLISKGNNTKGWLENWNSNYTTYIQGNCNFSKDDIFNYLVPDKRNCEWVIKNSQLSYRKPLRTIDDYPNFMDKRQRLITEIKIMGKENYLNDYEISRNRNITVCCPIKKKIKYINTSSWLEIECDYINYIEAAEDEKEEFRIYVDNSGDGLFF
jgi:hypothetical protein